MGLRADYSPGIFCWLEHSSNDPVAAAEFYKGLLGWTIDETDFGEMIYRTGQVEGSSVAGIVPAQGEMPPAWYSYVNVEDVELTTKAAEQAGATVVMPVTPIPEMGDFSVILDPQGAPVCIWQANGMAGCERVNDPGCLTLNQLNTTDPEAAMTFYETVFGWEFRKQEAPGEPYWGIYADGWLNGGMMKSPDGSCSWLVYFTATKALEDMVADIGLAGGTVLAGPMEIPESRILVAADSTGVAFAIFEGRTDD